MILSARPEAKRGAAQWHCCGLVLSTLRDLSSHLRDAHQAELTAGLSRRTPAWKHRRAEVMRSAPTRTEARLIAALQLRTGRWFFQVPVFGYIADFYFPSRRLIVELDGPHHHLQRDAARDAALKRKGLLTLRFSNAAVHDDLEHVVAMIYASQG